MGAVVLRASLTYAIYRYIIMYAPRRVEMRYPTVPAPCAQIRGEFLKTIFRRRRISRIWAGFSLPCVTPFAIRIFEFRSATYKRVDYRCSFQHRVFGANEIRKSVNAPKSRDFSITIRKVYVVYSPARLLVRSSVRIILLAR